MIDQLLTVSLSGSRIATNMERKQSMNRSLHSVMLIIPSFTVVLCAISTYNTSRLVLS